MKHRRRSLAEVQALVAEFEASGLKRAAFCQQRGLAVGTLDKYRQRVHGRRQWGAGLLFLSKWFPPLSGMSTATPGATVFCLLSCKAGAESKCAVDSMRKRWSAC